MVEGKIMLLLSAMVDKNYDIALKFYDPETGTIMVRKDNTYEEYCYADPTYNKLAEVNDERQTFATKINPVTDKEIGLTQAFIHGWSFARHDVATEELDLAGNPIMQSEKSDQVWESDIKTYESYLHDKDLTVGMYYDVTGRAKQVEMPVPENVLAELQQILESKKSGQFKEHLNEWAKTLSQPIPRIRRTAIDIEIDAELGRSIDDIIEKGDRTVTAISFKDDDIDRVLALGDSNETGQAEGFELVLYDDEAAMLRDAFKTMKEYPVVLTYNGMNFDLPYLESRARFLGIINESEKDIPFYTRRTNGMGLSTHMVTFRKCVHVDLYSVMSNKAFQIYVFGTKYTRFGLDDVSRAILGHGKLEHDVFGEQDVEKLANYCYHDSLLTYDLTAHDDDMLMNMLVIISRISKMPLDDVARYRVSQWIRSRFYYYHRKNNFLIPNRSDLNERDVDTKNDAITKGKKYQGGAVIQPDPGIYFDVVVVDFASLYPSIVKAYNISYETVRCPHEECRAANPLPSTNHWCCTKKYGMTSLIIGSLRNLRVQYYKRLSKDEFISEDLRAQYDTVAQALKVILNAAYGVLGVETFPLYFPPAAEAVTAIGRTIINGSIDICKDNDVKVLYGDSVLGDTPIVCERNGVRQIVPIKSLIAPITASGRQKHATLKVLSDDGFVDVKYSYIHKVRKPGYRIGTSKAYVEVTDDHSLIVGGKEVKPHQLKIGDSIDISEQHVFGNDYVIPKDIAWLLGFYLSDGTLETYCSKRAWKIVKNDRAKLEKAQKTMSEHLGFDTAIYNYSSEGELHTLVSANRSLSAVTEYFRLHCYSNTTKVVPPCILSGTVQVKKAFVQGLIDGDGHVDKKDRSIVFGQIHKSILAGYISVITALGYDYSIKFRKDKPNFISVRIIRNTNDARIRKADTVTLLERFEIDTYVYDLSTHNEHFRGGLGNVLLHNTDSVFLLSPSEEQINSIILQVREKYKVDLEVDKTYKFCVFSDRKKNYYGLLENGKMDIKGLAGKKSNTPQFVKDLFSSAMSLLETIRSEDDIDSVLEKIIEMIRTCINSVRKGDMPLESMAFTNLLGENLESYSIILNKDHIERGSLKEYDSKTKSMKPLKPGKYPLKKTFNPDKIKGPTDMGIYSRMPLHVKSALWMCRNDMEEKENTKNSSPEQKAVHLISSTNLKKGDDVSYIKMTKPVTALPLNMFGKTDNAAMEWYVPEKFGSVLEQCSNIELGKTTCCVDVEKYISLVTATLNPILEPLGVELQAKKSASTKKPPVPETNLDVFLQ